MALDSSSLQAYMKGDSKATIVCPVENAERQHGILMMIDL